MSRIATLSRSRLELMESPSGPWPFEGNRGDLTAEEVPSNLDLPGVIRESGLRVRKT